MTTDVYMVTYWKDADWLRYSVGAILKHLSGWRHLIVATPKRDLIPVQAAIPKDERIRIEAGLEEWHDGHLWQNYMKVIAPRYTDAEHIMHIDSDIIVHAPCSVREFCDEQGRPTIWWRDYDDCPHVPWRGITERAVGQSMPREFMQRFPFQYRRDTYSLGESILLDLHEQSIEQYIQNTPKVGAAFHAFCEFNFLGAVAFIEQRDLYCWRHTSEDAEACWQSVKQLWSYLRPDKDKDWLEEVIA